MSAPKSIAVISAEIPGVGVLDLIDASVTLDEARAPYAEARLTAHVPVEEDLELIDPRDGLRVQITASLEWPEAGHYELPAIVWSNYRRNLARDPETTATTEWVASGTTLSVVSGYLRSTATGGASANVNTRLSSGSALSAVAAAAPSDPFVLQLKVKQTGAAQYVRPRVGYANAAGTELGSLGMSPTVQTVPAGSGDYTLTFVGTLPSTVGISRCTASAIFYSSAAAANPTAGQVNETTDWLFDVGSLSPLTTGAVVYFSGATTDTTLERYSWTGTTNASSSTYETGVQPDPVWVPDPTVTRTFDLLLHARTVDQEAGTLSLTAESDEAKLIDGGHLAGTVDSSQAVYDGDVRTIVNNVLALYGASLESNGVEGKVTTNRTNLEAINPRAAVNTTGWAGTNSTVTRITGVTIPGRADITTAIRGTQIAATTGGLYVGSDTTSPYALVAGNTLYRVSAWVRSNVAKTIQPAIQTYTSGGVLVGFVNAASTTALVANTWTLVSFTVTTQPTAARMGAFWYSTSAWAIGNTLDVTGVVITLGSDIVPFFDGATTDAYYTYAWTGTANASTSTRTSLTGTANMEVFNLTPGTTHWDFLDPLVGSAGLRLFCDEARDWWLVNPDTYVVEGTTRISEGINATRGDDTISLQSTLPDGTPAWYSGVVVEYRWLDSLGAQQVAYDYSGTAQKVAKYQINRPYPGVGLAANRLSRATGRGRTQDLEALADLGTTPGQVLISTLPATPVQSGTVSAVTWHWAAEGDRHDLMDVRSRGLIDTPVNAWIFAAGAWSAATGTWAAATGSN